MGRIKVITGPFGRSRRLKRYLRENGASHIKENEKVAYCALSLTGIDKTTPLGASGMTLNDIITSRQRAVKKILAQAGIIGYDPKKAPYSPDNNPSFQRRTICKVDTEKIAGAKYFTMLSILGSTGSGVEMQKAQEMMKMAVILTDNNVTDTRMKSARVINVGYDHLEKQANRLAQMFEMLKEYTPGAGLKNGEPILIGHKTRWSKPVDLEEVVYTEFPEFEYVHRKEIDPAKMIPVDPNQFYETAT